MKLTLLFITLNIAAPFTRGAVFTNNVDADAFVRPSAPTSNYGGAGANSIAGLSATNNFGTNSGAADSFIRFNTISMVTNFNALYGSNNWVINGATLQVLEQGTPNNSIFNRGKGGFEIRWIANDNWTEGTGSPMISGSSGIMYTNETTLLNSNTDVSLGTYTNAGADGTLNFTLPLPSAFTTDMQAGGEVDLFMTAADANIGFTFASRSFTPATNRPVVIVSAVPRPGLAAINVSGADLNFSCTNGVSGGTYVLVTSSDFTTPIAQWSPIATNTIGTTGAFTITASNALANPSAQQFFSVQTR